MCPHHRKVARPRCALRFAGTPAINDQGPPKKERGSTYCLRTMFKHPGSQWEWIWTRLYGRETIVEVFQLDAIWYGAVGNEPLTVVLVRDRFGKYPDTAFFDTDREASDQEVVEGFSHRWSTEITNRERKSLLGSGNPLCQGERYVTSASMIAYCANSRLVAWFVNQSRMGRIPLFRRARWYLRKKNITFSDMLAESRRPHLSTRISREPGTRDDPLRIMTARSARGPQLY
jgi:hypothetical protein